MSSTSDVSVSLLPDQQTTLAKLTPFFPMYYLSGGTGLSFHLGHRISYDFDLFTDQHISRHMIKTVTDTLEPIEWIVQSGEELTFRDVRNVKVTFLYYPYIQIRPSIWKFGAWTDSLEDIVANKIFTIGQRAQIRDYIDLYYILAHGIFDIHVCAEFATEKYGNSFDKSLAVGQLCYYDDLDFKDTAFLSLSITKDEFCSVLTAQAKKIIDQS